ncbi:unnamed protein product [Caenorhabditis sp. 36 PRJEB53466]|nr:unnamed protein product [Caenorhabditis sp. 36 PRJEB53466]
MAGHAESRLVSEQLVTLDLPTPTAIKCDSFGKLVQETKLVWGGEGGELFDKIVFQDDDLYDVTQDSFRYGRVTSGTSYNLVTGKMQEEVLEAVKAKDEEADDPEDPVTSSESVGALNFQESYDSQMPKYFEYRSTFPEIKEIWTLLFDQKHYDELSTFELQAAICAALNSKHHLILCVGVDDYNCVTGVEMSAVERVVFRMALTRAVAGEFQPPLVKIPPKQQTGVSPMKRDVSELTPSIDVLFIPVLGVPTALGDSAGLTNRFLIVVRVKDITEKLYQLSSGRIYVEKEGRVVETASLNEAFHHLITAKSAPKPTIGSYFMREPEPFIEDAYIPLDECSDDDGEEEAPEKEAEAENAPLTISTPIYWQFNLEHFGWLLFGSALAFTIYRNVQRYHGFEGSNGAR